MVLEVTTSFAELRDLLERALQIADVLDETVLGAQIDHALHLVTARLMRSERRNPDDS